MNYVTVILIVDWFEDEKIFFFNWCACVYQLYIYINHSFLSDIIETTNTVILLTTVEERQYSAWMPMFSRALWSNNFTEYPKCPRRLMNEV